MVLPPIGQTMRRKSHDGNIADDVVYAVVCRIAAPDVEFHAKDVRTAICMSASVVHEELRRLQHAGVIRFTGRLCIWQRLR